jgi:hypothetical protein
MIAKKPLIDCEMQEFSGYRTDTFPRYWVKSPDLWTGMEVSDATYY